MRYPILLSILIVVLFIARPNKATAQAAVYYCPTMGAIGYAYSNDEDGNDIKVLEKQALSRCEQQGGTHCALLYETGKVGWGGIIKGRDVNGAPLVLTTGHQESEKFARKELEREYLFRDGIQYNDVLVITWKAE